MSYSVRIMPAAEKSIKKWKKSNAGLHKKFVSLLSELSEHPRTGIGHPEPLRGGNDITWSRHISAHDRIVYDIYDNELVVLVIEVEGHYGATSRNSPMRVAAFFV